MITRKPETGTLITVSTADGQPILSRLVFSNMQAIVEGMRLEAANLDPGEVVVSIDSDTPVHVRAG